jgi:uncharacterized protein YcbK (DUF882 family)
MNTPDLTTSSLILTCALSLAAPGCNNKSEAIQPSDHKVEPIVHTVKVKVRESIFPELEDPTEPEEPNPKEPPLPEHPEETRSVEFPSGESLPLVEWGEPENYKGCDDLSFEKDMGKIRSDCHLYNPRKENIPLVRIEGNETTQLSDHFQAWEFAKIDPNDIAAGNVDPKFYYEYEAPDPLNSGQKRTLYLYKVARINPELVDLLEEVRRSYGFAICPDETYRSYVHNHNTRAASESIHLSGSAMDINLARTRAFLRGKCQQSIEGACGLDTTAKIRDHIIELAEKAMKKRGGGGIGRYPNILHLDTQQKFPGSGYIRKWPIRW